MSYGVSGSGSLLPDIPDDPEVLFTNFLMAIWDDTVSGVPKAEINFGYEPDINTTERYVIKIEEIDNEDFSPDLADRYTQDEFYMNCHIWERDASIHSTTAGMARWKMRRYIKRVIKQNCRTGIVVGGNRYIKHLYLIGGGNVPEPEQTDWHHTVIVFKMVTWLVDAST
ncbi:hypothetical protein [Serratia sp. (in: enterobacteria)]|uniref:hypothetical protein n=1 Tax=Serratia sp. (in: enterobacteria) TaxID=616 RepID=UPI003989D699